MLKKTFKISRNLYQEIFVIQAIALFVGFSISYHEDEIHIEEADPQYVFDELMNCVLSLSLELPS